MKFIIQRIVSILIFSVGLIFAILGLFGVTITVNESDINNIIFGLGTIVATLIEVVPILLQLLKDKEYRKIMEIVNDVVWSVEELKGLSGPEKKQKAMNSIEKLCKERNIKFDSDKVNNMIESIITIRNTVIKK